MQLTRIGRLPLAIGALWFGLAAVWLSPITAHADWRKDAKEAALKYADQKKDELVRSQSKAAITALYKKLYAAKSGVSRNTSRTLAEIAIAAPDIDKMASDMADAYGSGDPDKIRAASEAVAVKFGEQLARLGSNAETRAALGSLIGKADKVREISQVLGNATSGTKAGQRAAAEYLGQALIGLTPAAGVIGFYQASVGAMKYAKGEYVNGEIEDLYRRYKNADDDARRAILSEMRFGTGGYKLVIDERRRDLEAQKEAAIGDAADSASDKLREHLTKTTEDEIIANIAASFESRIEKEKDDKTRAAAAAAAEKKAQTILAPLQDAILQRYGVQGLKDDPYRLDEYLHQVDLSLKNMPELDPNKERSLTLASRLLSALVIHGRGSKQYAQALAALNQARKDALKNNIGAPCTAGSQTQQLAVRLWQRGKQLAASGRAADGLPILKQSLLYCPDANRAAQVAALEKMTTAGTLDGTYSGPVRGAAGGTLTFVVTGTSVTGSITGAYKGDAISGSVTGSVSADGTMRTAIAGTLVDAKGKGRYRYAGTLNGRLNAAAGTASGSWNAKNKYGSAAGSWSGARR